MGVCPDRALPALPPPSGGSRRRPDANVPRLPVVRLAVVRLAVDGESRRARSLGGGWSYGL